MNKEQSIITVDFLHSRGISSMTHHLGSCPINFMKESILRDFEIFCLDSIQTYGFGSLFSSGEGVYRMQLSRIPGFGNSPGAIMESKPTQRDLGDGRGNGGVGYWWYSSIEDSEIGCGVGWGGSTGDGVI